MSMNTSADTLPAMPSADRKDSTSRLSRAARILDVLATDAERGGGGMRLADVSRQAGLPLTTTHRLLGELADTGLVDGRDGRFHLGRRLFELGQLVPHRQSLRDVALPFMEDLYEATHQTIHLAVLDGSDVLYLEQISGHQRVKTPARVGGRVPANRTALGKAILANIEPAERPVMAALSPALTRYSIVDESVWLAELRTIADAGYAIDREESSLGVGCVAVPVFADDRVVAAVSVAMPARSLDPERLAPAVRTAANSISRALGAHHQRPSARS